MADKKTKGKKPGRKTKQKQKQKQTQQVVVNVGTRPSKKSSGSGAPRRSGGAAPVTAPYIITIPAPAAPIMSSAAAPAAAAAPAPPVPVAAPAPAPAAHVPTPSRFMLTSPMRGGLAMPALPMTARSGRTATAAPSRSPSIAGSISSLARESARRDAPAVTVAGSVSSTPVLGAAATTAAPTPRVRHQLSHFEEEAVRMAMKPEDAEPAPPRYSVSGGLARTPAAARPRTQSLPHIGGADPNPVDEVFERLNKDANLTIDAIRSRMEAAGKKPPPKRATKAIHLRALISAGLA
jgi:hypothetical protein